MTRRALVIAIDGPSGAGKGTVARTVASRLAYRHVDTGAMYRAVAWKALQDGINLDDGDAVGGVARASVIEVDGQTTIDGHNVTAAIRTPAIDRAATIVAQHRAVRAALVERQRRYGAEGGVVMEGRDIGSVVFPAADVKVYLDASPDERARRRALDPAHAAGRDGVAASAVAQALEERDRTDRTRTTSPLLISPDAVYIDTTGLEVADVVAKVLTLVDDRLAGSRT